MKLLLEINSSSLSRKVRSFKLNFNLLNRLHKLTFRFIRYETVCSKLLKTFCYDLYTFNQHKISDAKLFIT